MRDAETNLDYFGARYYSSGMGHWMTPDWDAKPATVPYANFGDPQTLNLYAMVSGNPVSKQDPDGHLIRLDQLNTWSDGGANPAHAMVEGIDPVYSGAWLKANHEFAPGQNSQAPFDRSGDYPGMPGSAQQQNQYGRQADGSYKADPAKVKAAIDSKTPIGNGQCVAACSRLSGVTPHTDSWTPRASVLTLNDTTDVGLAIASFGPNGKFTQPGGDQNSAIYMGHDKAGNVMVVDQWPPPNKPQYNAPFEHPLANYGPNSTQRMENNASFYHVIVVP